MATIERYEDIKSWQKARELTALVYTWSRQDGFRQDFALCGQIRRAAVSVMSNIAEGYERGSRADFMRFLRIARASASEVQCQLYVALDQGYLAQDQFQVGYDTCAEIMRLITGLVNYLRRDGA